MKIAATLVLFALFAGLFLIGVPQWVRATTPDSTLVAATNTSSSCPSTCEVASFLSPTASDVLVVAIADLTGPGFTPTPTVSDTQHLTWTNPVNLPDSSSGVTSYIYITTVVTTGPDLVIVTDSSGHAKYLQVSMYDVAGVTASSPVTHTGTGSCSATCHLSTAPPTTFSPGAFLLALFGLAYPASGGGSFAAGSGFTLYAAFLYSAAEYATSGVSSPTSFPATVTGYSGSQDVDGISIALTPTTPPPPTTATTATSSGLPTKTTISCSPNLVHVGTPVHCTASVSSSTPPTGPIVFSSTGGGTFSGESCSISGTNPKTCTVTYIPSTTGNKLIQAQFEGDATHLFSRAGTSVDVIS
jgi:hypothetical protein